MAINLSGWNSPHHMMERSGVIWGAAIIGTTTLIGSIIMSSNASDSMDDANAIAGDNLTLQNKIADEQLKFQKQEAAKLEKQKDVYRNMKFTNPYANVKNQFADLKNPYENLSMENVMEDLTVNTKQAEFQTQQGAQQRANIMQGMQGAAGGSGIASLAQAMAGQGALQTQQISAQIGQQEAMNQKLKAQGAQDVIRRQQVQMAGQGAVDTTIAQGAGAADMAQRGGQAAMQEMEMSRQATLLGIQMGQTSGANAALQQAYANQMSAGANQANLYGQQAAAQYGMAGDIIQAGAQLGGALGGGGACFAEGDEVEMLDGTMKAIELIKIGDEVKSIKDNKVVKGVVTNTLIHSTNDVVEVIKINGITAEPKHPVFVDNKWILIGELETTTYQFIDNWYNLEVDGNTGDSEHNYIIGNIIASGSYPERTDSIVSARESVVKIKQI